MYQVIILDRAKYDMRMAKLYYSSLKNGLADKFESEVKKIIKKLQENPLIFGFRSGSVRVANIRKFRYQIHYHIEEDFVFIIAIKHGSKQAVSLVESLK